MTDLYQTFDSPEAFADYLEACENNDIWRYDSGAGRSYEDALKALREGDTTNLAAAQAILSKVDVSNIVARGVRVLEPCVAGFIPNVPAAISGHPEAMFRIGSVDSPSVQSPLSVYVEVCVSAGVGEQQLLNRGIAVLAFVLAMEMVRPVDLYVVAICTGGSSRTRVLGSITKVASRPMDVSRAVYMLTDASYNRRLHHAASSKQCNSPNVGGWPFHSIPGQASYEKGIRELLSMQPDDVYLPGGYLTDKLMLNNPVAWVQQMIEKHNVTQEE